MSSPERIRGHAFDRIRDGAAAAAFSARVGKGAPGSDPQSDARQAAAAMALVQLQAEMRKVKSKSELAYFVANEARAALRAQQVIVLCRGASRKLSVHTISSVVTVDQSSPLVLWMAKTAERLSDRHGLEKTQDFEASAFAAGFEMVQQSYPMRFMLWVPWIVPEGGIDSGMLLARMTPWSDAEISIARYLGEAFGHASMVFDTGRTRRLRSRLMSRRLLVGAGLVACALMAIPVPMTALAPVEVGPKETFIVTPGVDGVIRDVLVSPNSPVKVGQPLVVLNDTVLRNRAEIAEQEVLVAESKYKKAAQLAFVDARGRHEMAIAKSELDLKLAERDYARELLGRTTILAEKEGVAFYADKRDLIGKPVNVGEKLMEVADPAAAEYRIELPASDAIVIRDGARVKVFLDADPLNPLEARLIRASYKAAPREAQQFAFRLVAAVEPGDAERLRLGMRGTAQIYSDRVTLGFYLFRRPIAVARQWTGL